MISYHLIDQITVKNTEKENFRQSTVLFRNHSQNLLTDDLLLFI